MKFIMTFVVNMMLCACFASAAWANLDVVPVPAPAVPEGWTIKLLDKVLVYEPPKIKNGPVFQLRFTYSRNTHEEDATAYSKTYATAHKCEYNKQIGVGFFSLKCEEENTFAIVIGEVNNMYLIEVKGQANEGVKIIIGNYLQELINGKHVFVDRHIGDQV